MHRAQPRPSSVFVNKTPEFQEKHFSIESRDLPSTRVRRFGEARQRFRVFAPSGMRVASRENGSQEEWESAALRSRFSSASRPRREDRRGRCRRARATTSSSNRSGAAPINSLNFTTAVVSSRAGPELQGHVRQVRSSRLAVRWLAPSRHPFALRRPHLEPGQWNVYLNRAR